MNQTNTYHDFLFDDTNYCHTFDTMQPPWMAVKSATSQRIYPVTGSRSKVNG